MPIDTGTARMDWCFVADAVLPPTGPPRTHIGAIPFPSLKHATDDARSVRLEGVATHRATEDPHRGDSVS